MLTKDTHTNISQAACIETTGPDILSCKKLTSSSYYDTYPRYYSFKHLDTFPHTTRSQQAGKVAVWIALMQYIGTPTAFSSCMYVITPHQPAEHWQAPLASLYGVATSALGHGQRLSRCTLPCHGKQGLIYAP